MDSVSVAALADTCALIIDKLASASHGVDVLITSGHTADRLSSQLAAQLRMFEATVIQLRQMLGSGVAISHVAVDILQSALTTGLDIADGIGNHIREVVHAGGDLSASWNDDTVQDHARRVATQFQTFSLFAHLLALYVQTVLSLLSVLSELRELIRELQQ
jgi:hypothetical protein